MKEKASEKNGKKWVHRKHINKKNSYIKHFNHFYFFKAYKTGNTIGLSNFSQHKIKSDIGVFHSSEAMFQSYKNLSDKKYVFKLQHTIIPQIARNIGKKQITDQLWEKKQFDIMVEILYLKCVQNKDVFTTILKSGLRPFVQHTKTDCYWGNGGNDTGCNYLGKAWDRVRENIYEQFLNENKSLDKNISKYIK